MPPPAYHSNGYVTYSPVPIVATSNSAPSGIAIGSNKCRRRLSGLEVGLLCFALVSFAAFLGMSVTYVVLTDGFKNFWPAKKPHSDLAHHQESPKPCDSVECVLIAAHLLQNIQHSANPCEDFYEFACGRFPEYHDLPVDKPLASLIQDVENRLHSRLHAILEDFDSERQSHTFAKVLYDSCLNQEEINRLGIGPLMRALREIGDFPLLDSHWDSRQFSWERMAGRIHGAQGLRFLIDCYITPHVENSSRYVLECDQPKLGLKTRKYFLNDSDQSLLSAYAEYATETLMLLGGGKNVTVQAVQDLIALEIELAKISQPEESRRDRSQLYNPTTLGEFKRRYYQIDIDAYFKAGFPAVLNITDSELIIVAQIPYYEQLAPVLRAAKPETVANYLLWRVIQEHVDILPDEYQKPKEKFNFLILGTSARIQRLPIETAFTWEECVKLTTSFVPYAVGSMYTDKYFAEADRNEVKEIAENLRTAFLRNLEILDWMDESTRKIGIEKAVKMIAKTGYPDHIYNDTRIMEDYEGIVLSKTDLFANVVTIRRTTSVKDLLKLRLPVDRELWFESPAVVDAYYAPSNNEIVFPAGILQFPFFTMGAPHYINYAMIGAVIGHEITHGFDDEGRQHDADGNLNQWWDPQTLKSFLDKNRCLIDQYSRIEVAEVKKNLNGELTLGENIADNGGVKTAYNAYKIWESQRKAGKELALPGLYNFTADQMFFIAYANNWCGMMRSETYNYYIATEVHSPGKYRAVVPLQNFPPFSKAFNCPLGSFMNPTEKCAVW